MDPEPLPDPTPDDDDPGRRALRRALLRTLLCAALLPLPLLGLGRTPLAGDAWASALLVGLLAGWTCLPAAALEGLTGRDGRTAPWLASLGGAALGGAGALLALLQLDYALALRQGATFEAALGVAQAGATLRAHAASILAVTLAAGLPLGRAADWLDERLWLDAEAPAEDAAAATGGP